MSTRWSTRTKIVCTLGPSSQEEGTLLSMIQAGMDVARVNLSHGTREDRLNMIRAVRRCMAKAGKRIGIMLDTRGPEVRVGTFAKGEVYLETGSAFTLITCPVQGDSERAWVSLPELPELVKGGNRILLDDGNVELEVTEARAGQVITRVVSGGIVKDRKKVSLPGIDLYSLPVLDKRDVEDFESAADLGIDFVAASFVSCARDIREVRETLLRLGSRAKVIAKVESVRGVLNAAEILAEADGLMVARGDLGVEYPPEEVPLLQKDLIERANRAAKPVITATEMLESMVEKIRPTRAEASDVANAILDGTDAVMLSAETATGKHPVEAVRFMARIAEKAEGSMKTDNVDSRLDGARMLDIPNAVSRSAVLTASELGAACILAPTESGYTARMIARFRPRMPVYAATPHDETRGWLTLVWGVETILVPSLQAVQGDSISVSDVVRAAALTAGLVREGDVCVVTRGVPYGVPGTTNVMEVREVTS